jgi:hypothetical protein
MMELEVTKKYVYKVVPEWYDAASLSGEGTLAEQICEQEQRRATDDDMYTANFIRSSTTVKVLNSTTEEVEISEPPVKCLEDETSS